MRLLLWIMLLVGLLCSTVFANVVGDLIEISKAPYCQSFTQAVYNPIEDEYLVVWEDNRTYQTTHSDIYAQIIRGDGTLRGENIPVCTDSASQWWPHLDFDPVSNRYLIVFSDNRNAFDPMDWFGNYDVYAAILDKDGKHVETAYTEDDTCFSVCPDTNAIHYPDVAYNSMTGTFMVVWADYRNIPGEYDYRGDIFGQVVDANGEFIIPADRNENLLICDVENALDVPVVTYTDYLNEWLVVFGHASAMGNSDVWAQRVSAYGALRNAEGLDVADPIIVIQNTMNDVDPLQPRAQFNYEYDNSLGKPAIQDKFCECLITWTGDSWPDYNLYGSRLAFISDADAVEMGLKATAGADSQFFAYTMNRFAVPAVDTRFGIADADQNQNAPDIAWSEYDNEFFMHWEDSRNVPENTWYNTDIFGQRLYIGPDSSLAMLDLSRNFEIDSQTNCVIDTNALIASGGNLVGIAHNSFRNEFLVVYANQDSSAEDMGNDLVARIIKGTMPVGVEEKMAVPVEFALMQNYPNPFNPETTIEYSVSKPGNIKVEIYDITGKQIQTLFNGYRQAGTYQLNWNGLNEHNQQVSSGVYFYKMDCDGQTLVRKMTLVR